MSSTAPAASPGAHRRTGALGSAIGTVVVVALEFLLLHFTYTRGEPAHARLAAASRLQGAVQAAPGASTDTARAGVDGAVAQLASAGVHDSSLAPIRSAERVWADGDPAGLPRLRRAADTLHDSLAGNIRSINRQTDATYVALLLVASVGWMLWFRRLVRRQRQLERTVAEQELQAAGERRLAALVRNSADVILVTEVDGRIRYATPSARSVLGAEPDTLTEMSWLHLVHADDRGAFIQALAAVGEGEDAVLTARVTHGDGRLLTVSAVVTNLMGDPGVGGLVLTVSDITARVQLEEELSHQAFHDSLTGLANRQLFTDRLSHALASERTSRSRLSVLFCDLDEFKNINDSFGHGVGDSVLFEVAKRASAVVRRGDTVARFGGDEFVILLENTDASEAVEMAERLQQALRAPLEVGDRQLGVRCSIGVAAAEPGQGADELLRNADVAMYLAKSRGRGTTALYDVDEHSAALDRLELHADLEKAVRDGLLEVAYQPTVEVATGEVAGFEALARWTHPVRGAVSPVEFIPIAEQSGLIHELGDTVLRTACTAAVEFSAAVGRPLSMSVNVTAQQLARDDFVAGVVAALEASGLPATQLVLEITESALLHGVELVSRRLAELRDRGVRIAVDDFGTGYSSLAYLRSLPLDVIKIDKAFVDHVVTDAGDAALAEWIVTMGSSMNLTTVAEGVEDRRQAAWLAEVSCHYGQGYLWSRPLAAATAKAWLVGTAALVDGAAGGADLGPVLSART